MNTKLPAPFVATRQAAWWRLQQLTEQARRISRIAPDELDEMVHLYQRAGADLATLAGL